MHKKQDARSQRKRRDDESTIIKVIRHQRLNGLAWREKEYKMNFKKTLCSMLAILMLLSTVAVFASCGKSVETPDVTLGEANSEVEGSAVDNRFVGVDYDGREFRINTSNNSYDTIGTSNVFIEGTDSINGALVNDAVLERNLTVEELLGVDLVFTQLDVSWGGSTTEVRKLVQSGMDEYDLFINDCFDLGPLSIEGNFHNVMTEDSALDFDRPYWYKDYMADLTFAEGYQYLLAGDFFMDIIRSAHLILVNKYVYEEYIKRSPDELYDFVLNYEWTYDKLNELITDMYYDLDGNGYRTKGDLYGWIANFWWGATIPLVVSGNPTFIIRDEDGYPTWGLAEDSRADLITTAMSKLLNSEFAAVGIMGEERPLDGFVQNWALFIDGQLGTLENTTLRSMENDIGVLPYPMLMSSDEKYTTSTHDITEIGAVLITAPEDNMNFITTVIEVLNRETANILMPKYYDEELQVKCVDDPKSAAMIDIIHDNFGNSFITTFNNALGNTLLQTFTECAQTQRDFSTIWATKKRSMNNILKKQVSTFISKNEID